MTGPRRVIDVRPATASDLARVVDLWDREGGPTRAAGRHLEAERLVARDPEALLVATRGGELVGTLIVGWDGWRCHVYRLAVESTARREGVARALVERARQRAADLGAARIDAMVEPSNSAAVSFWEDVGFSLDADRRWSSIT